MPAVHMTASVYLFAEVEHEWRIGLIEHPRLGGCMIPGGHVEDEMPSDAAVRETIEETGRTPRLLPPPGIAIPERYPHPLVNSPWWIVRMPVKPDRYLPTQHIHEDHQYVAIADHPDQETHVAEHPFQWATVGDLPKLSVPAGTLVVAHTLFDLLQAQGVDALTRHRAPVPRLPTPHPWPA
ncbi:NUDIX domain-containing protein [Nonomuraea turkmeniaca]|uniref:NUDIX domain-containing protein n=1 Tax=Nonomuraea turkmeniaca TaxID=103838 RepID=A0A5S4EX32_9ACTN|nr:NUDIX domain-containing protein [Nonomuraea turkmeniaca]TMR08176.1 NUDIX domain-containing protein [Nonomuraea turkmeniaca]